MHQATIDFTQAHLTRARAEGKTIVEVGSLDVGGCTAFRNHAMSVGTAKYIGLDMRAGANVDLVTKAENMVKALGPDSVDGVLSMSTLEHVAMWREAVLAIKTVVRPGGWVILGAPGKGFPLHEFPADYWRFSTNDAARMFIDFDIEVLKVDRQANGFLLLATKPRGWTQAAASDLGNIHPYSMVREGGIAVSNKRAFLVIGPESSGQRLVRRVLQAAGCKHTHGWKLDNDSPLVVWGDSLPANLGANRAWQDVRETIDAARTLGYEVHALITARDLHPMVESQIANAYVKSKKEGYENARRSYTEAIQACLRTGTPFDVVTYESLVTEPNAIPTLVRSLGLTPGIMTERIVNGNAKWFYPSRSELPEDEP